MVGMSPFQFIEMDDREECKDLRNYCKAVSGSEARIPISNTRITSEFRTGTCDLSPLRTLLAVSYEEVSKNLATQI